MRCATQGLRASPLRGPGKTTITSRRWPGFTPPRWPGFAPPLTAMHAGSMTAAIGSKNSGAGSWTPPVTLIFGLKRGPEGCCCVRRSREWVFLGRRRLPCALAVNRRERSRTLGLCGRHPKREKPMGSPSRSSLDAQSRSATVGGSKSRSRPGVRADRSAYRHEVHAGCAALRHLVGQDVGRPGDDGNAGDGALQLVDTPGRF